MQRVRMLRSAVGHGGRVLGVGEEPLLADAEARHFIASGRAEPLVTTLVASFEVPMPSGRADGAPMARHRDPAPTRARAGR